MSEFEEYLEWCKELFCDEFNCNEAYVLSTSNVEGVISFTLYNGDIKKEYHYVPNTSDILE